MSDIKLSTQPYKGTRDFYPADMLLRGSFFGTIRETLKNAAFDEYGGPMLEPLDLYIAKSGEELAGEQTYNFEDRSGRRLAVRPEMTPTVARLVAAKINELNMPLKWYSVANFYRYERPQRGRLREFWQVNVDIFGATGYEADLEVISTAIRLLCAFGADEKMFTVHINNRRFFADALRKICGADAATAKAISKTVDKKNKVPRDVYEAELNSFGLDAEKIAALDDIYKMSIEEAVAICPESEGAAELSGLFGALKALGLDKYCVFDFGIIRGLDYYTGTVFEVFDNAPENNRAMFGGGRYDNLVGLFVKNASVSGVGFGFGDVTLENFLTVHSLLPDIYGGGRKILVCRFNDVSFEDCFRLAEKLRADGSVASVYLGTKKLGGQFAYADKEHYTHVAIMGADELAAGKYRLKNLETKEEAEYSL